jgi:hypothetical protein
VNDDGGGADIMEALESVESPGSAVDGAARKRRRTNNGNPISVSVTTCDLTAEGEELWTEVINTISAH